MKGETQEVPARPQPEQMSHKGNALNSWLGFSAPISRRSAAFNVTRLSLHRDEQSSVFTSSQYKLARLKAQPSPVSRTGWACVRETPQMPPNVQPYRSWFLSLRTIGIWGWATLWGGASCAPFGADQRLWSPPNRCQEQPLYPGMTTRNVPRHCQVCVKKQHQWLKTTTSD